MINVIATSELKPGCRDEFLKIFKANIPNVLAEEGCVSYVPCIDAADCDLIQPNPNRVMILETWASVEHLKKHLQAPHMKTFVQAVKELRASSELRVVEPA